MNTQLDICHLPFVGERLLILMSVWAPNLHIPMVSMVMSYWKSNVCISIDLDVFKDTNASTELDRQRVVVGNFSPKFL